MHNVSQPCEVCGLETRGCLGRKKLNGINIPRKQQIFARLLLAARLMSNDNVSHEEYIAIKVSEILKVLDGTAFCYAKTILDEAYRQCRYTVMDLKPFINQKQTNHT